MENLIKNPGLKHLAENIFLYLDYEDIINCQIVSESWNRFLENPMFWLKKWTRRGLSKENKIGWIKAIRLTKNIKIEHNIVSYMKKVMEKKICQDIPCYINAKAIKVVLKRRKSEEILGCIQLHAPESSDKEICGIILKAVAENNKKLVKILAPLVKDPNISNYIGTPIQFAVFEQNLEIIKILAPLTDNPNRTSDGNKYTPIYMAILHNNLEIIKILAPLVDNPNEPSPNGITPIWRAAAEGYTEIVKFLAPLSEFPNTPNPKGVTPIQIARNLGYQDIVQVLRPFEVKEEEKEETQRRKNNADKQLQDIKLLFGFFSMLFMFMLFTILFVFSLEKYF